MARTLGLFLSGHGGPEGVSVGGTWLALPLLSGGCMVGCVVGQRPVLGSGERGTEVQRTFTWQARVGSFVGGMWGEAVWTRMADGAT